MDINPTTQFVVNGEVYLKTAHPEAYEALDGSPMSAEEFREIRKGLDIKLKDLAERLRIHETTAGLYQNGKREIPGPVACVMRIIRAKSTIQKR